ncbi:MAG: hypothetical protein JXR07_20580 [Reichenbachiella sp.]
MDKPAFLNERWQKSSRIDFSSTEKVDEDNGILYGVTLCQVGEAKGHGLHLEQEFVDDCAAYGAKHHAKLGMKSRFGHPSMSNETLGTEMGRFKEFRVEGEQLKADLHLLESSNLSPTQPGMKDWMLSMASEDPAMIMCSIVFVPDYYYQYSEKVEKIRVWEYDSDGNWVSANSKMKTYCALKELQFCDIVDQGAATDKLFSEEFNSDKFSVIATQFLNENPKVDEFIKASPEKLFKFIEQRHGKSGEDHSFSLKKIMASMKEAFSIKPKEIFNQNNDMEFAKSLGILEKENPTAKELAEVKAEIKSFTGENEKFTATEVQGKVDAALEASKKELGEKDQEIVDLKAEIKELGEASEPPKPSKKEGDEKLEEGSEEEKEFSSYDHNKEALNEIKDL